MVVSLRSGAIFRIFTEMGKTYVESAKFDNSFDMGELLQCEAPIKTLLIQFLITHRLH